MKQWTAEAGLTLHPEKTRIADAVEDGFEFLGFRFVQGRRWPRKKSMQKLKDTIRSRTRRTNGQSLKEIIGHLNPVLRGWFGYFKHAGRYTFRSIDGWIRMRLRSILRKRLGKEGRGRGIDHHRWPNLFFTKHGFYSMYQAHVKACQSALR